MYRLFSEEYAQVGTALATLASEHREVSQTVQNLVDRCSLWNGVTKLIYENGYAKTIGIHNSEGLSEGYFLHSDCRATRRGDTDIQFITTLPIDEVASVTSSQTGLDTSSFISNIELAKDEAVSSGTVTQAEISEVVLPTAAAITVASPVTSTVTVHGVAPTSWSSVGSIDTKRPIRFTVSGAFGLDLAPDRDAAKIVSQATWPSKPHL